MCKFLSNFAEKYHKMETHYLLLLPLTVVLIWTAVFVMNGRYRQLHDRLFLLVATGSVVTYYVAIRSLVEGTRSYYFLLLDNLETLIGLSVCPLFFLYMRSVARDAKWHSWNVWLFVPAVVIFVAGTILSLAVGWDRILEIRLDGYHPFHPSEGSAVEWMYYIVNIQLFDITIETMAVVMIALCIYYLVRYERNAEQYYANIEDASIDKIRYFLVSSIANLIILFLLTYFILNIVGTTALDLLPISVIISVLLWVMAKNAYGIVVAKDSLDLIDSLAESDCEVIHPMVNDQIREKLERWLCSEEKEYCREGITLADIAHDLQINARVLSAYINRNKGMNFRRWINTLRIEEAKRLIRNHPNEKLTYIAALCGFVDLASFSKSFHSIEGCSPLEYKTTLGKPM